MTAVQRALARDSGCSTPLDLGRPGSGGDDDVGEAGLAAATGDKPAKLPTTKDQQRATRRHPGGLERAVEEGPRVAVEVGFAAEFARGGEGDIGTRRSAGREVSNARRTCPDCSSPRTTEWRPAATSARCCSACPSAKCAGASQSQGEAE
jgi:hypothetical protein